jgi:hypothetical protein
MTLATKTRVTLGCDISHRDVYAGALVEEDSISFFHFFNLFFNIFGTLFNIVSFAAPQIPMCRRTLRSNPGLMQLCL